jgi:3-dehydroquinate dehydratase-2
LFRTKPFSGSVVYRRLMRIVVLNGVNLDVLGRRDPELYGGLTLSELETRIYEWANAIGCTVRCRQTNHEGEFVDWCHDALDWADGVIVNPGAWAHYSWAIRDAVELLTVPVVEVHLSNIDAREEWRKFSVLEGLPSLRIVGKGPEGYREALEFLVQESS